MEKTAKKISWLILFLVLLLGLGLRFYKISLPLADHHSWRQSDSAAVIRNLALGKFNVFKPQWDNLVATNSRALPNPNRYFFEDFPASFDIYPALLMRALGPGVISLRLPSIFFFFATAVFLFLLVRDLTDFKLGILTVLIYSVLPFSVFFTRGVFQENPLNFYAIASFFFLNRFLQKRNKGYFLPAVLLNALLFLTKPYALVFLLPEAFLFWQRRGKDWLKDKSLIVFFIYFIFSLIPFALWWFWVRRFPEGIPYSGWLLNEGDIRFKGAFFHWIFAERIGKLILGYYGLIFFGLGVMVLGGKDGLFYVWFLALLIYTTIIAKGSVTHDYYQIPFLPVIAYFCAKGADFIYSLPKKMMGKVVVVALMAVVSFFALAFSWYEVRGFYDLKSGVDLAGDFVNKNIPPDALVIAGDGADPTLLYNCGRRGWTVGFGSTLENTVETVRKLKGEGAEYYVTTTVGQIKNTAFEKYLRGNFSILKETDQFIVFELGR